MNKKVCLYCRVATKEQLNLETQTKNLKIFAKEKGLEVVKVISEFGSGLNFERKGLSELMKIAEFKKANMILTRDVARIGRDYVKMFEFIDNIKKHIEFKTLDAFDILDNEWDDILSALSKFFSHKTKEQIAS